MEQPTCGAIKVIAKLTQWKPDQLSQKIIVNVGRLGRGVSRISAVKVKAALNVSRI